MKMSRTKRCCDFATRTLRTALAPQLALVSDNRAAMHDYDHSAVRALYIVGVYASPLRSHHDGPTESDLIDEQRRPGGARRQRGKAEDTIISQGLQMSIHLGALSLKAPAPAGDPTNLPISCRRLQVGAVCPTNSEKRFAPGCSGRTMFRYLKDVAAEPWPVASTHSTSPSSTPPQFPLETPATEAASGGGVDLHSPSASVLSLPQPPESSSLCAPFLCRFEETLNALMRARSKVPLQDTARTERMMRRTGGAAHHESSTPVCWAAAGVLGRPMLGIGRVTLGDGAYYVDAEKFSELEFTEHHLSSLAHARRVHAATQDIMPNVSARKPQTGTVVRVGFEQKDQ